MAATREFSYRIELGARGSGTVHILLTMLVLQSVPKSARAKIWIIY